MGRPMLLVIMLSIHNVAEQHHHFGIQCKWQDSKYITKTNIYVDIHARKAHQAHSLQWYLRKIMLDQVTPLFASVECTETG